MKHYYLAHDNSEVFLGDYLTKEETKNSKYGNYSKTLTVLLTDTTMKDFIKKGIIIERDDTQPVASQSEKVKEKDTYSILKCVDSIADTLKISKDSLIPFLDALETTNPIVVFSLLLKELSNQFEKAYKQQLPYYGFLVSTFNGQIIKVPMHKISNLDTVAFFRSKEDALYALSILKDLHGRLWKQED